MAVGCASTERIFNVTGMLLHSDTFWGGLLQKTFQNSRHFPKSHWKILEDCIFAFFGTGSCATIGDLEPLCFGSNLLLTGLKVSYLALPGGNVHIPLLWL